MRRACQPTPSLPWPSRPCISLALGPRPGHDRGKVLVQTALMVAGGGESFADIEHLRAQRDLFGFVPSDSTVFQCR